QTFIIPVYNWWNRLKYTFGLKLYDWIAGRLSLGSSVFISRKKVIEKLPNIISKNLTGGILYHDGQFDDARLTINLVQTIFDNGGFAINYMKVIGLFKEDGKVSGAIVHDTETNEDFTIKSKVTINATGVFVDDILRMDKPDAKKNIAASQGVHLVLDRKFMPGNDAVMIPRTSDGRVLFIVPWHNRLLAGTTDTPIKNISLEPVALEKEIQFILETATGYLTVSPKRKDVLSVFAGLRPLAIANKETKNTKEISRSHKILVSSSQLFSIIGGKWTTYRKMGEDMINKVEKDLEWKPTISKTASLQIHGYKKIETQDDPLYYYGSDEEYINKLIEENTTKWISKELNIHEAQVLWAVREEMARTVEDALSRRTRCLLLDSKESIRIAPAVAEIMAAEMNEPAAWIITEVKNFNEIAENYMINAYS
ncbi:MAG: glycerol-3-phosphate dehydrogenase/oxidase, partial [Ginsengibacter sp.]